MNQAKQAQNLESQDSDQAASEAGSQMIVRALSPAVRLWLRSQTEAIKTLKFEIGGSDRQILRGCIPKIRVCAEQVVYQGLHLSYLDLTASQIQINLGQVLKGKPLQLLKAVPVIGELILSQADLEACVASPLLRQALVDLLQTLLQQVDKSQFPELAALQSQPIDLHRPHLSLETNQLTLATEVTSSDGCWQFRLKTELRLLTGSSLQLANLELWCTPSGKPTLLLPLDLWEIDLGQAVNLDQLTLESTHILCRGQFSVTP